MLSGDGCSAVGRAAALPRQCLRAYPFRRRPEDVTDRAGEADDDKDLLDDYIEAQVHGPLLLAHDVEAATFASASKGFWALVTHPWAVSGGCAAGERRAHAAEIEHGEGDECFGCAETERDPGQQPQFGV